MKLKKISAGFLASAFVLATPFTVFASSGWDYVGGDAFSYSSRVFYSTGGDFKFCLRTGSPTGSYALFEDDEEGNPDEYVGARTLKAGECAVFSDINRFVDGDNKKAEFKVIKNINTTKWAGVDAWD